MADRSCRIHPHQIWYGTCKLKNENLTSLAFHRALLADVFEEFYSPSNAAQNFLFAAVKKRKEVLPKTMTFVMQVLTTQNLAPRQQAGALQIVGAVADVLMTVSAATHNFDAEQTQSPLQYFMFL